MAIVKNTENIKCWRWRRQIWTLWIAGGNVNGTAAIETSMAVPQKIKRRITVWPSNPTSGFGPRRNDSRHPNRHPGSTAHNGPKAETTQTSINTRKNKQNVVMYVQWHTSQPQGEGNSHTCYVMDRPWRYNATWRKQTQKDKHGMIPLIRGTWRAVKFTEAESGAVACPGLGGGECGHRISARGAWDTSGEGRWWRRRNSVNVLKATEVLT